MRVVVTGGFGALGSHVVRHLQESGHEAVIASRRSGVDLTTGAGLDAALRGADAVVHTADTTNPRQYHTVTIGATRTLLEACRRLTHSPNLVTISICGVDENPFSYYRAKATADRLTLDSGLPATVVRATQFHSFAAFLARAPMIGPLALTLRGMPVRPVDISWVGRRLAEIAVGPRPSAPHLGRELTGPEQFTMARITDLVAEHAGRRRPRLIAVPPIGATLKAFARGAVLPGPDAEVGGETFEEWLAAQPPRLRGR